MLHLLAMAREAGVPLAIDDFQTISNRTPIFVDLKPGGHYVAVDVDKAGGIGVIAKRLVDGDYVDGARSPAPAARSPRKPPTPSETPGQEVIRPLDKPLKPTGGLAILRGTLAPDGCVIKLSGHNKKHAHAARRASSTARRTPWPRSPAARSRPNDVVVIRYEGPRGGPGMREMLGVTGAIVGAGLADIGGAGHRRPLQRRNARLHDRARRAGSPERRPHRGGGGRRHHEHRRDRGNHRHRSTSRDDRAAHGGMESARASLHDGCLREVLRAGVFRVGRRGDLEVLMPLRIAVLGAGNMGGALIGGIVNRVTPADHVVATTRTPERAAELSAKYGIRATAGGNREAAAAGRSHRARRQAGHAARRWSPRFATCSTERQDSAVARPPRFRSR